MSKLGLIMLLVTNSICMAQDSKLYFKSFSIGNGASSTFSEKFDSGLSLSLDATMASDKNLFNLNLNYGTSINIFGGAESWYGELNLTYGRELRVARWLGLEGQIGLGYIYFQIPEYVKDGSERKINAKLGVPIRSKVLFYCSERFALGVGANANLNSFTTLYSGNLVFRWQFK